MGGSEEDAMKRAQSAENAGMRRSESSSLGASPPRRTQDFLFSALTAENITEGGRQSPLTRLRSPCSPTSAGLASAAASTRGRSSSACSGDGSIDAEVTQAIPPLDAGSSD